MMLCRSHKDKLYTNVSKIKEILTKMYFLCLTKDLVPIYTTFTQYTDFIFGSNLVPL